MKYMNLKYFLVICLATIFLSSQAQITISGSIMGQSSYITSGLVVVFEEAGGNIDSTVVDTNDHYSINFNPAFQQSNIVIRFLDCNGDYKTDTIYHDTTQVAYTKNFSYCTPNAMFTYSILGSQYCFQPVNLFSSTTYQWTITPLSNPSASQTATSITPCFTMTTFGDHIVNLMVYDSTGNFIDSSSITIHVIGNGSCNAQFNKSVNGLSVDFTHSFPSANLVYSWSFGDGNSSALQNPSHTYSLNGSYTVILNITDTVTNCQNSYWQLIQIGDSIYGNVYADSNLVSNGTVYLIKVDTTLANTILTSIDSVSIQNNGRYVFQNVPHGETYFIKAATSSASPYYSSHLPSYYLNSVSWSTANVTSSTTLSDEYDIHLVPVTNSGGLGFIGGLVNQGTNKKGVNGNPIEGMEVYILSNTSEPVAYRYSDQNGKFSFENLKYGVYKLTTDVPGIPSQTLEISINEFKKKVERVLVTFNINEVTVAIADPLNIDKLYLDQIQLFPNPVNSTTLIKLPNNIEDDVNVQVVDLNGKLVKHKSYQTQGNININLYDLKTGFYFIHLVGENWAKTIKFMKE